VALGYSGKALQARAFRKFISFPHPTLDHVAPFELHAFLFGQNSWFSARTVFGRKGTSGGLIFAITPYGGPEQ
jgi:hypothetical protein